MHNRDVELVQLSIHQSQIEIAIPSNPKIDRLIIPANPALLAPGPPKIPPAQTHPKILAIKEHPALKAHINLRLNPPLIPPSKIAQTYQAPQQVDTAIALEY